MFPPLSSSFIVSETAPIIVLRIGALHLCYKHSFYESENPYRFTIFRLREFREKTPRSLSVQAQIFPLEKLQTQLIGFDPMDT